MPSQEGRSMVATAPVRPARADGPRWRALLEARWQARLKELTELSLAYHGAADAPGGSDDGTGTQQVQTLLSRAVAAQIGRAHV